MAPVARSAAATGIALLSLSGCSTQFEPEPDWTDQLVASGPCYEANLFDGLDSSDTTEAHLVFACLNQAGMLDALRPVDEALDAPTRGAVIGLELAEWVRIAPSRVEDLSLASVLDGLDALLDDAEGLAWWGNLAVELIYGVPASDAAEVGSPASPEAIEAGLVVPVLPVVATASTILLDTADLRPWLADALRGELFGRAVWTVAGIPAASSAPMLQLAESWPDDLANALVRVRDSSNDHAPGATGNSLRDLITTILDPAAHGGVGAGLRPILEDEVAIGRVRAALAEGVASGWIEPLPAQVFRLTTEDSSGDTLGGGEDSALTALVRLLARANQPADCSIDLGITEIEFSLGNLAVTLLEQFAALDPEAAVDGVDLLSDVLGYDLSESILSAMADTGVCPAIDAQLVADLAALERLNETPELLRLLISLLGALDDHIVDVADLVTRVHEQGLVDPIEELVRDLGDAPLTVHFAPLLAALLEPSGWYDLDELPAGASVLELEDLVDAIGVASADWALLLPAFTALGTHDGVWTVLDHVATLLVDPEAQTRSLLGTFSDWMYAEPDTELRVRVADWLEDDDFVVPLLRVAEAPGLEEAIATTAEDAEGPLPYFARLHLSGTFESLRATIALVRDLLQG